jgi:hypothetical protein
MTHHYNPILTTPKEQKDAPRKMRARFLIEHHGPAMPIGNGRADFSR